MPQSLAQIYVHLVFSTKERRPFIQRNIESQLYAYMADTIKRMDGIPCLINGTEDHIHVLSSFSRTVTLAKYIEEIKRNSSRWIKTKDPGYEKFSWQNGYGAFSVSSSRVNAVKLYIAGQKEHHRVVTFKEEFLEFLRKYNIEYDERYLWD